MATRNCVIVVQVAKNNVLWIFKMIKNDKDRYVLIEKEFCYKIHFIKQAIQNYEYCNNLPGKKGVIDSIRLIKDVYPHSGLKYIVDFLKNNPRENINSFIKENEEDNQENN
jgi:hypothetical protein